MKTVKDDLAKCPNVDEGFKRPASAEDRTREALDWAIDNTCLAIPPHVRNPFAWKWDADDLQLRCLCDDGEFLFHVAGEQRGSRRFRIAVLSWEDDDGKATWEADIPDS